MGCVVPIEGPHHTSDGLTAVGRPTAVRDPASKVKNSYAPRRQRAAHDRYQLLPTERAIAIHVRVPRLQHEARGRMDPIIVA